jgi:PAS domain S-box-containing protein
MLLQDFEKNHSEDQDSHGNSPMARSGNYLLRPERKLLFGTVQFYEDILESLNDIYIAVITITGKHVAAWGNNKLHETYGFTPAGLKGKLLEDIYDENAVKLLRSKLAEVCEKGERISFRFQSKLSTGLHWIHVLFTPLSESNGSGISVVGCFQNVTETLANENKIRQIKEDQNYAFERDKEGILSTNNKGVIISANKTLTEMIGYEEDKLVGFKLTHLPFINSRSVHFFQNLLDIDEKKRDIPGFEMEWKTAQGQVSWSHVKVEVLSNQERFTGLRIRCIDITEQKLIEKELLKSKQAYKVIIENAGEAIFILQNEKIVFSNSKLADLLGIGLGEPILKSFKEFIHTADQPKFRALLDNEQGPGKIQGALTLRLNSGGNPRWVECKMIGIDWNDTPAFLFYATDVTAFMTLGDKEKKSLELYKFISDKVWEFIEQEDGSDTYRFIADKMREVPGVEAVLLISYNEIENCAKLERISGSHETIMNLYEIIHTNIPDFLKQVSHEQFKNLAFGNLIKYNDGLFERGSSFFPGSSLSLIQKTLEVEGVYLIGLKQGAKVYGNAMIFLKEGATFSDAKIIESIARMGAAALHRKIEWDGIRSGEKKYRHIFESLQDIYLRADIDGTITEISPSVYSISGYKPDEIKGKHFRHFFPGKNILFSYAKGLLQDGLLEDKNISLKKRSGEIIHASLNARLILNEKGRPAGWEGFIRDISERRMMEERFQLSEEKFRTLADFTFGWEYWSSPEGKLIYMSPSCLRISGYTREEFYSNSHLLSEITHPEDMDRYLHHIAVEETKNKTDVLKFNYRIVTKDGQVKWINHICQEVFNQEGKSLGRRVSNRDITERKEAEDKLRLSEERFRTLFFESPDAVFVENYDGVILDVNPAACKLHGIEKEELIGKNILDLILPEEKEQVAADFSKWVTGELANYRGKILSKSKNVIPIEIHGSKIHFSGQGALLFIVRDITEVVEKEEWLRKSVERAEHADKLKSAFLANVSHEIRTPMNAIIGFSEILTNQDLSAAEREEFINYITQGGNTLMNLIEDIIDITKIEAGQIKINFSDCKVDNLLDELYATFLKIKNKTNKSGIELRLNKPALESGFVISTDPYRIRQILTNLLGNAIKFTKVGFVEFGFILKGANQIEFYVKDSGIGIPADKMYLIFERFGQVNDNNNPEFKGTGLGLSISKKLAELLGGDLRVDSVENVGSAFYLTLPVSKQAVEEVVTEKKPVVSDRDWSAKTFLIAEDSILNYTFLEALLQKTKVKLLWAKNGREAVDMCRDNPGIDLVLMDIKMPVLSGLEAIGEIRQFNPDLPIVVQTAYAMPEDRDKSLAAGGDEHLTKPLNVKELFETITRFVEKQIQENPHSLD